MLEPGITPDPEEDADKYDAADARRECLHRVVVVVVIE